MLLCATWSKKPCRFQPCNCILRRQTDLTQNGDGVRPIYPLRITDARQKVLLDLLTIEQGAEQLIST